MGPKQAKNQEKLRFTLARSTLQFYQIIGILWGPLQTSRCGKKGVLGVLFRPKTQSP